MKKELLGAKAPNKECTDKKCPFHGQINVKRELFKGKIVKKDINRSATIEWEKSHYVPKYERYEVRRSRMRVHNPPCIDANVGDHVLVARTRPLSKDKNHVIIELISSGLESEIKESKSKKPANKKKSTERIVEAKKDSNDLEKEEPKEEVKEKEKETEEKGTEDNQDKK